MRKSKSGRNQRGGLKSLQKAFRILEAFSIREPRLPLTDIARRAELPLSTTHRMLGTLHSAGFIDRDGERDQYRLGIRLLELGSIVLSTIDLHREALPFIEALARES